MSLAVPDSNTQLVPVDPDGTPPVLMRDGIRVDEAEAEYQAYMDQLYAKLEPEKSPINTLSTERTLTMHHPWHNVGIGDQAPEVMNAVIEIPAYSRVKTELDRETGLLKVDRILSSSVIYPANYGFVPETLCDDGDPLDVLVLCQLSVPPLSLIKCRPIGIMPMVKGGEADDKIIAVAVNDPEFNKYQDVSELPTYKLLMINQFFNDYRAMERLEVKTFKPLGREQAQKVILEAKSSYHKFFDTE